MFYEAFGPLLLSDADVRNQTKKVAVEKERKKRAKLYPRWRQLRAEEYARWNETHLKLRSKSLTLSQTIVRFCTCSTHVLVQLLHSQSSKRQS